MHALYVLSVFVHIVCAAIWLGGMLFLVLVVVPWLRRGGGDAAKVLRETGPRFRDVSWVCFALLLLTGTFNLWVRGVRLATFCDSAWMASSAGRVIVAKLCVFLGVVILSAVHDFLIGPSAARAMVTAPGAEATVRLRARATMLGRLNALLALILVMLAVLIVRGVPG
jgi:putative copper export protein